MNSVRGLAATVAVALGLLAATLGAPRSATAADDARPSVCVMYFQNNSGDATFDPLQKGLADMLVTDLAAAPELRVVERARLQEVLGELELQRSEYVDPATAGKVGRLLGATYVVTGALAAVDPQIRIDVRMIKVESGEVVVADRIVGEKTKFFELEQALAARFVEALGARLGAPASGRVEDVATVLDYARGLDLADRGELEAASKQLGKVVTAAPQFKLAQTRYEAVLRQLMEARKKRATGLGDADRTLLEKADAVLAGIDPKKADKKTLQRYFGYRALRGNLILGRIMRRAGGQPGGPREVEAPPDAHADLLALTESYVANQRAMMEEVAIARGRKLEWGYTFPDIDGDDKTRAAELGLGSTPDRIAFASPQVIARMLAEFLCLGWPGLHNSLLLHLAPPPAALDARWEAEAKTLLDEAIADIAAHEKRYGERETVRALRLYGECLFARGRKMEAIARWQSILDTYPTNPDFDTVEGLIRDALGAE